MSILDAVKKFASPYGAEEFDDEEYEEGEEEYEEEEAPAPRARSSSSRRRPLFGGFGSGSEESGETDAFAGSEPTETPAPAAPRSTGFSGHVVGSAAKQDILVYTISSFNETETIAKKLMANVSVVLNMENIDMALCRRIVDFMSGATFALQGTVKKVNDSIYMFCPHHVNVASSKDQPKHETDGYV